MSTIPSYQSGLIGINSGLQSLNQHSAKIASSAVSKTQPVSNEDLLGLITDEQQVQANSQSIKAYNSTLGTIIDVFV